MILLINDFTYDSEKVNNKLANWTAREEALLLQVKSV